MTADRGRYPLVIFDLDGTLADTLPLIYYAFSEALSPFLPEKPTPEEIRSRFGPPDQTIIRNWVSGVEAEEAIATYIRLYESEHQSYVEPFPGIVDLLTRLEANGVRMAVVTGKSRRTALITLEQTGLDRYFELVLAGDDVGQQKPHPEALLKALEQMSFDPSEGVMVGDSAADAIAGQAAALRTVGVLWGSPDHDELLAATPHLLVETVDDLAKELIDS